MTHKTKKSDPKPVQPREQIKEFDCRCHCSSKFSEDEKENILKQYVKFSTWSEQTLYLQSMCRPAPIARHRKRKEGGNERKETFNYFLEIKRDKKAICQKVCQKAFISLLGIKRSRLRWKVQGARESHKDGRGLHHTRPNRLPEEILEKAREFIRCLPARESHYSRQSNRKRKYMDASMTIRGLHKAFLEKNPDCKVMKYTRFYDVFVTEFNIGIGYPRSDLCDTCESKKSPTSF